MEEENTLNPINPENKMDVIQELIDLVDSVQSIRDFRRTQRKEAYNLMRRLKLLLLLLEEIRDLDTQMPKMGIVNLRALGSEDFMIRFHSVYEKLNQALEGMPYTKIGISKEVKEQVELMRMQLRRAKRRTETQDMEVAMDMMVLLSTKDERNADSASIERLANKLALHTIEDLRVETIAVRKLVKERAQNTEANQQIINLLSKCKQIAGVEDTSVHDDLAVPKALAKCPSLAVAIPNEFMCPVTLEIMTDPVIVATGQTYEIESIQKWLDSDHRTCPKTSGSSFMEPNDEISSMVQNLSSNKLEEQRKDVRKIRMVSKESPERRILIANGAITLLNLSIDESNKKLISREEPIPSIVEILKNGTIGAKENPAAALFSLLMLDENKAIIGLSNGIPPLVELLQNGTIRGKKDAVTALFNLSLSQANKARAVEAGIVAPLLQLLKDNNLDMVNESLSLLLLLASHIDGRRDIGQLSVIETLVDFIKDGTPKNKECSAALLLELSSRNTNLMLAALQYGVYADVVDLLKNGTNRGQRKANSILQLMSKSEQIP
ncbi:unnamed protein product [Camellia sinensis]